MTMQTRLSNQIRVEIKGKNDDDKHWVVSENVGIPLNAEPEIYLRTTLEEFRKMFKVVKVTQYTV